MFDKLQSFDLTELDGKRGTMRISSDVTTENGKICTVLFFEEEDTKALYLLAQKITKDSEKETDK